MWNSCSSSSSVTLRFGPGLTENEFEKSPKWVENQNFSHLQVWNDYMDDTRCLMNNEDGEQYII